VKKYAYLYLRLYMCVAVCSMFARVNSRLHVICGALGA